jgi:dTMP kinase
MRQEHAGPDPRGSPPRGGRTACEIRDPGSTTTGDRIRSILLDPTLGSMGVRTELLLYLAARAQLVEERIRPALAAGEDVVSDRFLTATVAYQGYGGGLDPAWIWRVGRDAVGGPDPDLCVLLDLDVETARTRIPGTPDRMEAKDGAFHERVREGFRTIAEHGPLRCVLVSATGTPEEVAGRVWREVSRVL